MQNASMRLTPSISTSVQKIALLLALSLAPCVQAHAADADDQEAAALAWLRASAHSFADETPTRPEADAFVQVLGEARVYGLGEATHGDHQDQAFKAAIIKALIEAGRIDTVALECNRQAATGFDRYVHGGALDLVALMRATSFFRTWQDDEFAGLMFWLRAWNETAANRPVRVIGVDNQDGNRDIRFALDFIQARDPALHKALSARVAVMLSKEAQAAKFYKWVVATPKPVYDKASAGVQDVIDAFEAHRKQWGQQAGYEDAAYSARIALQGLKQFDLEAGNPDIDISKLSAEYNNRRDVSMAANLVALTEGHRAALWAHDVHVLGELDPAFVAEGYVTMGSQLRAALGKSYVTVGFAWSEGSFNAIASTQNTAGFVANLPDWTPQSPPNQRADDLGRLLAAVGPARFWIDLRHPPAQLRALDTRRWYRGWNGATFNAERWQTDSSDRSVLLPSHDVLVYFHTITPSGMWKKKIVPR